MTRTMRAWRKANSYVRSGQHEKAIYWLSRTHKILAAGPPKPSRFRHLDAGYTLSAVFVLLLLFVAYYA
jgi:hypothetical protein